MLLHGLFRFLLEQSTVLSSRSAHSNLAGSLKNRILRHLTLKLPLGRETVDKHNVANEAAETKIIVINVNYHYLSSLHCAGHYQT